MKLSGIIFTIFLVWQIVSSIMAASQKKKDQEQRRAQLARREGQQPQSAQVSVGTTGRTPPTTAATSGGAAATGGGAATSGGAAARAADLAARRREQLDQLRLRRAQRSGAPAKPVSQRPVASQRVGQTGMEASRDEQRAEHLRQSREQAKERALHSGKAQSEEAKKARATRQREAKATRTPANEEAAAHSSLNLVSATRAVKTTDLAPTVLRSAMHNRTALRQLIIMHELISEPLSLRKNHEF